MIFKAVKLLFFQPYFLSLFWVSAEINFSVSNPISQVERFSSLNPFKLSILKQIQCAEKLDNFEQFHNFDLNLPDN